MQGLSADVLERLPTWQFNVSEVHIRPGCNVPADEQPAALCNALRQLGDTVYTWVRHVRACDWQWTVSMAEAVCGVLAAVPRLDTVSVDLGGCHMVDSNALHDL